MVVEDKLQLHVLSQTPPEESAASAPAIGARFSSPTGASEAVATTTRVAGRWKRSSTACGGILARRAVACLRAREAGRAVESDHAQGPLWLLPRRTSVESMLHDQPLRRQSSQHPNQRGHHQKADEAVEEQPQQQRWQQWLRQHHHQQQYRQQQLLLPKSQQQQQSQQQLQPQLQQPQAQLPQQQLCLAPRYLDEVARHFQTIPGKKSRAKHNEWTPVEERFLVAAVERLGEQDWVKVAEAVGTRNASQCRQKWVASVRPGLIKGQWTDKERRILDDLRRTGAPLDAKSLANGALKGRSVQQIMKRWENYVDPTINRRPFTEVEDATVVDLHLRGFGWAVIARALGSRTAHMVGCVV